MRTAFLDTSTATFNAADANIQQRQSPTLDNADNLVHKLNQTRYLSS